jgi:hypothetical protein
MNSRRPLWGITSYFNPIKYRRRLENYRAFRASLSIPLVTVEHSPNGDFQLRTGDAEILIQLRGGDILWQKERLLNIAVAALPSYCDNVAILDCDVVFERPDWADAASEALGSHALVQPFQWACDLPKNMEIRGARAADLRPTRSSFAFRFCSQDLARASLSTAGSTLSETLCAGFAWMAPRSLLAHHGIYDAFIVGSGARALALVAIGEVDATIQGWGLNDRQMSHYRAWADPFFATINRRVGYIDGKLFHLWHGDIERRRYGQRHVDFKQFDFDPYTDIALDENQCWRWNSKKPEMHRFVREYFMQRLEDG